LTVISIERLTFQKISKHSHDIHCSKTVKNITDWPALQPVVLKVHRQNHGVSTRLYSISWSTMRCCNAVHLWKRCCCNSGRM